MSNSNEPGCGLILFAAFIAMMTGPLAPFVFLFLVVSYSFKGENR